MSFEDVLRSYQGTNALARSLIGMPAFDELHVLLPDPKQAEPAFIRATSWLYCLYFEAGRVSITFLRRLGEAYALVNREESDAHIEAIRCLRTELHHNLGFADSDLAARNAAEGWRRRACGTALPRSDEQWYLCYERLVGCARSFLASLDEVVRRIEAEGPAAESHLEDWRRRLSRDFPAAKFDPLIEDAKCRLAREALNTVTFRNRHVGQWRKHLDLLEDDYDFSFEAVRLIEKALLHEDSVVIPITGRDIIDSLGIKPGPRVAGLLEEAQRHFAVTGCKRDDLLDHLRAYSESLG